VIPKIIHYCWFGGNTLPQLALECIASWRKFLPDYEIWMWVETEFANANANANSQYADKVMPFDVNIIPYTEEAYKQKKYAFVSDYARFWIMYKYGGIYFDTDVEVIRPMDDIIVNGAFMGYELDPSKGNYGTVAPGLGLAFPQEHVLVNMLLDYYKYQTFDMADGKPVTIVGHTTDVLVKNGLKPIKGIQTILDTKIYPAEYFCPIHNITKRLHITDNTRSIHRYMDSWNDNKKKPLKDRVKKYIPEWVLLLINKMKH